MSAVGILIYCAARLQARGVLGSAGSSAAPLSSAVARRPEVLGDAQLVRGAPSPPLDPRRRPTRPGRLVGRRSTAAAADPQRRVTSSAAGRRPELVCVALPVVAPRWRRSLLVRGNSSAGSPRRRYNRPRGLVRGLLDGGGSSAEHYSSAAAPRWRSIRRRWLSAVATRRRSARPCGGVSSAAPRRRSTRRRRSSAGDRRRRRILGGALLDRARRRRR